MEQITIEWVGNTIDAPAKWHATVTVVRPGSPTSPFTTDTYGEYGATPLEAVTELARVLAKVVGYERSHAIAYAHEAFKASVEG